LTANFGAMKIPLSNDAPAGDNNRLTDRSCMMKNGQRKSMKIVKMIFAVGKV
jgi:hypothetical protein